MPVTINGTTGIAGANGSATTPAVQGGDDNTGIFFPTADTVAVATGGTERMRINSSGSVGIGTTTPTDQVQLVGGNILIGTDSGSAFNSQARLRIQGAGAEYIQIKGDGTGAVGLLFGDATDSYTAGVLSDQPDNNLRLVAGNALQFQIGAAGQLGIGGASYGTAGQVLTSGGPSAAPSWADGMTFLANQATTSGTAFDFTVPSTAREIEVLFQGTSMSDASDPLVQLIVSGTPLTSGYTSGSATSGADSSETTGWHIYNDATSRVVAGIMRIVRAASGVWVSTHSVSLGGADANGGGLITGVGTVTGIRVTRTATGSYDAGNVTVSYR